MKTINKILLMSAVTLALTAVLQAKAGEALLSPRAQGNQINQVAGINNDVNVVQTSRTSNNASLSPRSQGNQIVKVAGTNNDPDLVAATQALTGSPSAKAKHQGQVFQIAPVK